MKDDSIIQSQKELNDQNEKYKLLIEGVKDYATFIIDTKGKVESWNTGAAKLFGYLEEEVIGINCSKFYPKESSETSFPTYELLQAKRKVDL